MSVDMNKVELLAKLEKVLDIQGKERLTEWYGDYGIFEPKLRITQGDIDNRIKELSEQIEHNAQIVIEIKETLSREVTVENPQDLCEAMEVVMKKYQNRDIRLNSEDDLKKVEFSQVKDEYVAAVEEALAEAEMSEMDFEMEM